MTQDDREMPRPREVTGEDPSALEAVLAETEARPVEPSALEAITRGEVDVRITTAHRFPRNLAAALKKLTALVTSSVEVAEECHYCLSRRGRGEEKNIEGPSARFAELLVHCWGNLQAGSRVIRIGERTVTAQGLCHDLEGNVAWDAEVERRIVDRRGKRYSDDMITTTCNAAGSIAVRNAIFKCVPKALWVSAYQAALRLVYQSGVPLSERRSKALEWWAARGVTEQQIYAKLGVKKLTDLTADHLLELTGIRTALREGATTIEEVFSEDGNGGSKAPAEEPVATPVEVIDPGPEASADNAPRDSESLALFGEEANHDALWKEWGELRGQISAPQLAEIRKLLPGGGNGATRYVTHKLPTEVLAAVVAKAHELLGV